MIREVVTRHSRRIHRAQLPQRAPPRKDDLEHPAGDAERYDGANEFLGELCAGPAA